MAVMLLKSWRMFCNSRVHANLTNLRISGLTANCENRISNIAWYRLTYVFIQNAQQRSPAGGVAVITLRYIPRCCMVVVSLCREVLQLSCINRRNPGRTFTKLFLFGAV